MPPWNCAPVPVLPNAPGNALLKGDRPSSVVRLADRPHAAVDIGEREAAVVQATADRLKAIAMRWPGGFAGWSQRPAPRHAHSGRQRAAFQNRRWI